MYQGKLIRNLGIAALALAVATCDQAQEPPAPSGTAPGAAQPAQSGPARLTEFAQQLGLSAPVQTMRVNAVVTIPVTVKNTSTETWPATPDPTGAGWVRLAYHWLDNTGKVVVYDGLRTELPYDLAPGEAVTLNAKIQAPAQEGDFMLRLSMVQEGVAWFEDRGAQPLDIPVTLTAQ